MIFINKLYLIFIICIGYLLLSTGHNEIQIPEESLRFRIIPNSNNIEDQNTKLKVKDNLEKVLPNIIGNSSNIIDIEKNINDNMYLINDNIRKTLDKEKAFYNFNISLGKNYFPEKEIYGVKYPEGNYESLVITLGDGDGDNWWCVLFPPLCLVEADENDVSNAEYTFFIKEIIDKYKTLK